MPRPKLTPHQANMLGVLVTYSTNGNRFVIGPCMSVAAPGWVPLYVLGSKGALDHLVEKGYAERAERSGPRGGLHLIYRPTEATIAAELDARAARRNAGRETWGGEAKRQRTG